jgi:hypothetical protein
LFVIAILPKGKDAAGESGNPRAVRQHPTRLLRFARNDILLNALEKNLVSPISATMH